MAIMTGGGKPGMHTFARLLLRLHGYVVEGKGDSEEADALRDEMDQYWNGMTEAERERLRGLSEDLDVLTEGGVKLIPVSVAQRKEWSQNLKKAWESEDWDQLLKMLRRPPSDVRPDAAAFLQARCWEHLGDLETALVFAQAAERLNSENAAFVMLILQQLDRLEAATECAARIIDNPEATYETLYLAASVLLAAAQRSSPIQATHLLGRIVEALRRAHSSVRKCPPNRRTFPETESSIVCMLGLALERLGRTAEALQVYDEFLARYPAKSDVLTFRGIARYDHDHASALRDFQEAVHVGASQVWPYYLLAHASLERADHNRCLWLCQGGLGKTTLPEVLARLHEWMGISRAMLGHPMAAIRESFELAQRLDLGNPRIAHNRDVAENMIGGTDQPVPSWRIPAPVDAKEGRRELLSQHLSLLTAGVSDLQLVA